MASTDATDFRLSVLNPGGRDLEQYFDEPVGPGANGHPPVNLHSFAARTGGWSHRPTKKASAEKTPGPVLHRREFRAHQQRPREYQQHEPTDAPALKVHTSHQNSA